MRSKPIYLTKSKVFKQLLLLTIFTNYYFLASSQIITETFNSSGTFTVPAGITSITVEGYGGGGAGGGSTNAGFFIIFPFVRTGGGGGGGGYASSELSVTPGQNITVNVGTGGSGNAGGSGGNGGASFLSGFEGNFFAAGGNGGTGNTSGGSPPGGAGGTGNVGTISTAAGSTGGAGSTPLFLGTSGFGGNGAGPSGGTGGAAVTGGTNDGITGNTLGGGGSGSTTSGFGGNRTGGNGSNGRITITYDLSTALPIELIEFSGNLNNLQQVELRWATASEKDNDFFTIERSSNGRDFYNIATIPGAGDHVGRLDYSYLDPSPLHGFNYYRLKQTDYDGSFSHSEVIRFNVIRDVFDVDLQVYPNPLKADHKLFLLFNPLWDHIQELELAIVNSAGKRVWEQKVVIKLQGQPLEILIPDLGKGWYVLQAKQQPYTTSKKLWID